MLGILLIAIVLLGCEKEQTVSEKQVINGCDLFEECEVAEPTTSDTTIKESYEYYNGKTNSSGKAYRTVVLSDDHPFVLADLEDIVKMINKNRTFYVYIGDEKCPWCRSVIEKAVEISKEYDIDTIYYLKIWDDEGNEILRDKYVLKDGIPVVDTEASVEYYRLLNDWNEYLNDYTLNDDGLIFYVGEKRIYAPSFIFVEHGVIKALVSGISEKQSDSRQELSEEILLDEEEIFREFFSSSDR